ncbi:MAG: phosphoribosylanthranilate isomerase [Chloroflexota bacterium]|nr:phosphoribosylanthranilate isomerase [Chloroflexota bacterium]
MAEIVHLSGSLPRLFARGAVVKICGLREPVHAQAAAVAGADLLGFIFAPARRQVTTEVARACIEAARSAVPEREVHAIGVFVDAAPGEIRKIVREADLNAVQLHGSESPEFLRHIGVPVIKTFRPRPGTTTETLIATIDPYREAPNPPKAILLDGFAAGAAGGTGARADWSLAASLNLAEGVFLGGGLDSQNVAAAIRMVRPVGVDVSSGVETDGVKDIARIEGFVQAARLAFQHEDRLPFVAHFPA